MFKSLVKGGLVLGLMMSSLSADSNLGKKYYKKMFNQCDISGTEMAIKHTKAEWEELYNNGKFSEELKRICSKAKLRGGESEKHIYDFLYSTANENKISIDSYITTNPIEYLQKIVETKDNRELNLLNESAKFNNKLGDYTLTFQYVDGKNYWEPKSELRYWDRNTELSENIYKWAFKPSDSEIKNHMNNTFHYFGITTKGLNDFVERVKSQTVWKSLDSHNIYKSGTKGLIMEGYFKDKEGNSRTLKISLYSRYWFITLY